MDDWSFDYGFHVNVNHRADDPQGLCWEGRDIVLSGALRSKTRRKCERVVLTLSPEEIDTTQWTKEMKGFGSIIGVRDGALIGFARLPSASFRSVLTALAAGKVRGLYLCVDDVARGSGIISRLFTIDPDAPDE